MTLSSRVSGGMLVVAFSAVGHGQPAPGGANACERLARAALPHTTITLAEEVTSGTISIQAPPGPAGAPAGPTRPLNGVPPICRVAATLAPSADSDIKIEVWLPLSG